MNKKYAHKKSNNIVEVVDADVLDRTSDQSRDGTRVVLYRYVDETIKGLFVCEHKAFEEAFSSLISFSTSAPTIEGEVFDRCRKIITQKLDLLVEINGDTKLSGDLGADSLDAVEIAMALEDEFEVSGSLLEAYDVLKNDMTLGQIAEEVRRVIK